MIRINLLPVKRKRKPKPLPSFVITTTFITLFAVIVIGYFYLFLNSKVSDLKDKKATDEKRLAELKQKIKDVENYEKDNKAYAAKKDIIEDLRKKQNVPLRLLDEVSAAIPNGVWLTALTEAGDNINLEGYGFTNDDIVSYVDNLKGSKYLSDVNLTESHQAAVGDIVVYQFRISMKVKI